MKILIFSALFTLTSQIIFPGKAWADCTPIDAGVITCTGNNAVGISETVSEDVTLDVSSLTSNITPASGPGVLLDSSGSSGSNGSPICLPLVICIKDDGGNGSGGHSVTVDYTGNVFRIEADSGIIVDGSGGKGGKGSSGIALIADGGDGGTGGDAGPVNVTINSGVIITTGDDGYGIHALSQGGKGGNGGDSFGLIGSAGKGGLGGNGGTVEVVNAAAISTSGDGAHGILAESIAGNGGDGGDGSGLFVSGGGPGSDSGNAEAVSVTNAAIIKTTGDNAIGILAFSFGGDAGGGGAGGGLIGFGSGAAAGGDAGDVTIVNDVGGNIVTTGDLSHAIYGQSVGGGGGQGGSSGGLIALGGDGGAGGVPGAVDITSNGILITTGAGAIGIYAQSIGGGGGDGGDSGFLVSVGGDSSEAGNGAAVAVTQGADGSITTSGEDAIGILAQSIGGGGGNGGSSSGLETLGGTGSGGGNGGTVTVDNSGDISTAGASSDAIYAQSVGGGGGRGGFSGGTFSLGGSGDGGGDGDAVTVINSGALTTAGSDADGIFAQSIGGGGGKAGGSVATGVLISLSMGADGGDGGDGGAVSVTTNNALGITTVGDNSNGIFAQSIGDGGGKGSFGVSLSGSIPLGIPLSFGGDGGDGGDGDSVMVDSTGPISTAGFSADGIFAQSVGGGGGNGGFSISVGGSQGSIAISYGGDGGEGGSVTGGPVSVSHSGDITTTGASSTSLSAQSIGGGGGSGGFSISVAGGTVAGIAFSYGGGGGDAGNAGTVDVNVLSGVFTTSGDNSIGIFAQSVGGGGGDGGFSIAGSVSNGGAFTGSFGGTGGGGGDGAGVTVTSDASSISTAGNDSSGINAQSLGGGGGNGGFSISGAFSNLGALTVTIGGTGGGGGNGGTVNISASSNISTMGNDSFGIQGQSVGGGGGNGGFSVAGALSTTATTTLSVGGFGGEGGKGMDVSVTSSGDVSTTGNSSDGIQAQSIGGGGGNGGFSIAGGVTSSGTGFGVSIGGTGNSGATAGTVTVIDTGLLITTEGDSSSGIQAQSVGGGGGNGGFSIGFSRATVTTIDISVGGFGDEGGSGDDVNVTSSSSISTLRNDSPGILAKSIGGGGGDGGFSIAGGARGTGGSYNLSVGGTSLGSGGDAGAVSVIGTNALIMTEGNNSSGIQAQSIGGGGGSGGLSAARGWSVSGTFNVSVGGFGGEGGVAAGVSVTSAAQIGTLGNNSSGIKAQSIGGGGGDGGFSTAGGLSRTANYSLSVGGSGGIGGTAGNVTINDTGTLIMTEGNSSYGIQAQSIGGGGGSGGQSSANGFFAKTTVNISVGGFGDDGGTGGDVSVTSSSSIATLGNDSSGISAQSIGGGGGNGGLSISGAFTTGGNYGLSVGGSSGIGGSAGTVMVEGTGEVISTEGNNSSGILARSVGGGGGSGGASVAAAVSLKTTNFNLSVGGFGDDGGKAAGVSVISLSSISTLGDSSSGIYAGSIGGGGGSGGFSVVGSMSISSSSTSSRIYDFSLGGSGGSGGSASEVMVESAGELITTGGNNSSGILALSLGGGGGSGGFSVSAGLTMINTNDNTTTAFEANISIGGDGDDGGTSKDVSVTSSSSIATLGNDSSGIQAQSIGGGGGSGGFSISGGVVFSNGSSSMKNSSFAFSLGGTGGTGGTAGDVTVASTGALITTEGNNSSGIYVQSLGGGGGNGGFSVTGDFSWTDSLAVAQSYNLGISIGGSGNEGGEAGALDVNSSSTINTQGNNSSGILAQSIGGGGGSGGFSVTGAFSVGASTNADVAAALDVSVGGSSDDGGKARDVSVTSSSSIATQGNDSSGILAQSIGGGGGNGGFSVAGALTLNSTAGTNVGFSVGGSGGSGSTAGAVVVASTGEVITTGGNNSSGIYAQSAGGGGGNGGFSVAGGVALGSLSFGNLDISIGGFGDEGGNGEDVNVTSSSGISTTGNNSPGIFAQSLGGGGGSGGFSITGDLALNGGSFDFSLGGSGNSGGEAGAVSVENTGDIFTTGNDSSGIFAQSIGGGGGDGGFSVTGAFNLGTTATIAISIGGFGDDGGDADDVRVTSLGADITTAGDRSYGIFAQSVGGGGGNGGFTVAGGLGKVGVISLGLGGFGGDGGDGGDVTVIYSGTISVSGDDGVAVFAQSVGGGGGTTGFNVSFTAVINVDSTLVGGDGTSGDAGTVTIIAEDGGVLTTTGRRAPGIFLQSVGGGGGSQGMTVDGDLTMEVDEDDEDEPTSFTVTLGGDNDEANDGNAVSLATTSSFITDGEDSPGVFLQSIGGGGGTSGTSITGTLSGITTFTLSVGGSSFGGVGSTIDLTNTGAAITTSDLHSPGILAQSIGGGGGATTFTVGADLTMDDGSIALALGGSSTEISSTSAVTLSNDADIGTEAYGSSGILAQSIGGGGGILALYVGGDVTGLDTFDAILGGTGAGGDGGAVDVTNSGDITTLGDNSYGIFAQSVGGGGGLIDTFGVDTSADALALTAATIDNNGIDTALGQDSAVIGNGGAITIDNDGAISTSGDGAIGIFAQSVGGGGGVADDFAGTTGGDGAGGSINITHSGSLVTQGDDAAGIFAQSVGGQLNGSPNAGGDISITVSGSVEADGEDSDGIFAQSAGGYVDGTPTENGDITVVITEDGSVSGGGDSGMAVLFADGNTNALTNYGFLYGSVDMGANGGVLNSQDGATFQSGVTINLGAGNLFTNAGIYTPGDQGTLVTTTLTGDFIQTDTGSFLTDIDLGTDLGDVLMVSGAGDVNGALSVNFVDPDSIAPGQHDILVLQTTDSLTDSGLVLDVVDSVIATYSLLYPNGADLYLSVDIDFAPAAFDNGVANANQLAVGDYINATQASGGAGADFGALLVDLLQISQVADLLEVYDSLRPEAFAALTTGTLFSNLQFVDAMQSCRARSGINRFVREGQCAWAQFSLLNLNHAQTFESFSYNETTFRFAAGFQAEVADETQMGLGFAYDNYNTKVGDLFSHDGERLQLAATLKRQFGATSLSLTASGGFFWGDAARFVIPILDVMVAQSKTKGGFVSGHVRLAHTFDVSENWYLRPLVDLGVTYIHLNGFTEAGAGDLNLVVSPSNETFVSLRPGLGVGGEIKNGQTLIRPYARVGVIHFFSNNPVIEAAFQSAPQTVAPFIVTSHFDATMLDVVVGIDILSDKGLALRAIYTGQFSTNTTINSGSLRFSIDF